MTVAKPNLIPVQMRLPPVDMPRRQRLLFLHRMLGTGRLGSVRFDLYADASGKDDWNSADQPWYVLGIVAVRDDCAWSTWKKRHRDDYQRALHWSDGEFWSHRGGVEARPAHLRQLCSLRPWQFAWVIIAHRNAMRATMAEMEQRNPHPRAGTLVLWTTHVSTVATFLRSMWRRAVGFRPARHLIRRVICNNWAASQDQDDASHVMNFYGDFIPEFRPGSDPGIGIADGLAWGFRSALRYPTEQILPWSDTTTWDERLQVSVLATGTRSTHCRSMAEVRAALTGFGVQPARAASP